MHKDMETVVPHLLAAFQLQLYTTEEKDGFGWTGTTATHEGIALYFKSPEVNSRF